MKQIEQIEHIIQDGDLDALASLYETLKTSTDFEMMYDSALLLASYGFLREADGLYEALLTHLPDEDQLKIDRANTLIELGEEDRALDYLKSIKRGKAEYVQALLVQADYYQMIGLSETAIEKIKEAYELVPNEPILQFAYAELLLDAGRYAEAARFYEKLLTQVEAVGDINIHARLAETYSAGGAYEEALPYYEKNLEKQPSPDDLFGMSFALYQLGQAKDAVKHVNELIDMDPDYYAAYMLKGQCYLALEQNDKAYEAFQAGIKRDAYDKALHLSAGKCALKLGNVAAAEDHLSEALALEPDYIEAFITLGSLYNETEQDEALLQLTEQADIHLVELPLIQSFLAYAYERMENYTEAYTKYKMAYNEMQEDHEFLRAYANFLIEDGKRTEALPVVKALVLAYPEDQYWSDFLDVESYEEE